MKRGKSADSKSASAINAKTRLRIISGILFVLSAIVGSLSRKEEIMLTRMKVIGKSPAYVYSLELLAVAALFLITALTLLVLSFKKAKK